MIGLQLDSGLHKDPQFVVVVEEETNASFTARSISGCLGPTWELQENMPLLYRSTPTKPSSLVEEMKIGMS